MIKKSESLGKNRAEETVRLLGELNDSVRGIPDTRSLDQVLQEDPTYLISFSLIIAHNLPQAKLEKVSSILWDAQSQGQVSPPLIVVRTAGFLSDFSIQFKEHPIITSHSETTPSLRIDKPFPSLLAHAFSLNFENMDVTDHGHVPFVVILVKVLQEWKNDHGGNPPTSYAEKQEFKKRILKMKKKDDEENFDEAHAQAYRAWTATTVPSDIEALFHDPSVVNLAPNSDPFYHLVKALQTYTSNPPHTLPLSSTLPDMKSDTVQYIHLQNLYKRQAEEEKSRFAEILKMSPVEGPGKEAALGLVDEFVKNSHSLRLLKGKKWGDEDNEGILAAIMDAPGALATHLSLSALSAFEVRNGRNPTPADETDKEEMLNWIRAKLTGAGWTEDETMEEEEEIEGMPKILSIWEHVQNAVGEISRSPTAELPTTSALVGGMVAQEAIKIITKQYVPINGICAVDLVSSTTGTVKV
ncbi:hypothetical protein FRC02_002294 [Tulasnella sp. 418]|nr:hypothetical protein FRC02_002294 [Tulasnella sp. 418]